jgi:hypothetical protein
MTSPVEQHLREDPRRVLALLGHVDRVLEPHHREEGQGGRRDHRPEGAAITRRLELGQDARDVALAGRDRPWRRSTMTISSPVSSTQVRTTLAFTLSPTPRKLTAATSAMKPSADHGDADARPATVRSRSACEKVGGKGARGGRGRGDPGAHHREGDDEGDEMDAEGLVRIERGARRARVFRDQFEIAERGDHRRRGRRPGRAARPRRRPASPPARSGRRCRSRECRRR